MGKKANSGMLIPMDDLRRKAQALEPISQEEAEFILNLPWDEFEKVMTISRKQADKISGKKIYFYYTGDKYPALSLTGEQCSLMCNHCKAELLKRLPPVRSSEELVKVCRNLERNGAKGCLLTGGCDAHARVPIGDFAEGIKRAKEETSLTLIAHTGPVEEEEIKQLKDAGLDGILLDIVGSPETTKKIYGIEIPEKRYIDTLKSCENYGISIISPHVCVGLDYGKLSHELNSLRIIQSITPTTIVIIALMPLLNTPMKDVRVNPEDVARIVAVAKLMFPSIPITLGCAKSAGDLRSRIDELGIRAGVSAIAMPTESAREVAEELGYSIEKVETCCGVPPD